MIFDFKMTPRFSPQNLYYSSIELLHYFPGGPTVCEMINQPSTTTVDFGLFQKNGYDAMDIDDVKEKNKCAGTDRTR